jgi:cardiolipin synthase
MKIDILVGFDEFWATLSKDIASARQSVSVQTFAFEGDAVGNRLSEALLASPATEKLLLADSFTKIVLSDRFRFTPQNLLDGELRHEARETAARIRELKQAGVGVRFTNPYGITPRRILSRNHKKLIVIDDRAAYIGGINFSEHNAAWHDMMLRIEDRAAVAFLHEDFRSTWNGHDRVVRGDFDGLEVFTLDGRSNREVFGRVLSLIDDARRSIFVESPYITFPFYERLRTAARRGVEVQIVTPEQNNWNSFGGYARLESARSEIDLRLYQGGMTHLKAMLIDDEILIAGSSNFDYFSYRVYQEILAIVTEPETVLSFRDRVVVPDLANAKPSDCNAGVAAKQWLGIQMKLLDAAFTILT